MEINFGVRDGLVVEPPIDIEIPDPGKIPSRNPCRLRALLQWVDYGGDDIGSKWEFKVTVNSGIWLSGSQLLQHDTRRYFGQLIIDTRIESACEIPQVIPISVKAREFDTWFDDVGWGETVAIMPCVRQLSSRQVFVLVSVDERRWWWRRLGWRNRRALLVFVLEIQTQCET